MMSDEDDVSGAWDAANTADRYPVAALLPAGSRVPPRYLHVAALLCTWGLADDFVQIGLVMRFIERGIVQPHDLSALLGPEAVMVAQALAEVGSLLPRPALQPVEPIWKLFVLTYLHPTAAVLKIAELFCQLRQDSSVAVKAEVAQAAAHVCARLGIWEIRADLLDAQARLADPLLFRRAREILDQSHPTRVRFFQSCRRRLLDLCRTEDITAQIERRQRRVSHVIDAGLDSVRSTFPSADAVLVFIEDVQDCYRALGAINRTFPVVSSKLRDYIGCPKDNGYQALHTLIEHTDTADSERVAQVEIRISTAAMNDFNRYGYLAYLAGKGGCTHRPSWWTNRQRWVAAYRQQSSEIFVFTPQGEAILLPRGSTVLDFAVRVHSDLGVFCRGARLNGFRALPGEALESGDICEVLIDQHGEPADQRLLAMARTNAARHCIRRALQKDKGGAARGKQIFRDVLANSLATQEIHASETSIEQQVAAICQARNYATVDAFYRAVARGEASPAQIVRMIVSELLLPRIDLSAVPINVLDQVQRVRLALCCKPRPSAAAIAVSVHHGHELKIHAAGCDRCSTPAFPIIWKPAEDQAYVVDALYEGWDRPGLIRHLASAINAVGAINIRSFHADVPEPSLARIRFSFETPNREKVAHVRKALEQLPERRNVDLRAVTLIDEGVQNTTLLENPYGPQPVGRWPLFVGRDHEVRQVLAQLEGRSGASHVIIRGPKRIGKSSLLQNLSRYHLLDFRVPALLDLQSLPTDELSFPRLLSRISHLIVKQTEPRAQATPLDPATIASDPIRAFGTFLQALRSQNGDRFVVLIDEFGVILSRLRGSAQASEFFDQWRAMLNDPAIYQHLSFIVVLPDSVLVRLDTPEHKHPDFSVALRIGELGHPVRLAALDEADARDLMMTPVRTHLAYDPHDLDLLVRETGGHPYYIHLVCAQIVTAIQVQQRRTGFRLRERQVVPPSLIHEALESVAHHDDAFHHVLTDSTPATGAVLRAVAALTTEAEPLVTRKTLHSRLDQHSADLQISGALIERPDLFNAQDQYIGIRVALVARWLRRYG